LNKEKFISTSKEVVRATGIVFGDIGTSPIYTLTIIFLLIDPTKQNVMGVLSLIFWTLIVIVTLQYAWLAMSLSTKGEGGIIVLKEILASGLKKGKGLAVVTFMGYIGVSLLLGDGVLTPAISILSAVEGLALISGLENISLTAIIIITCLITIILFSVQSKGVHSIARYFGPITVLWFIGLFFSGIYYIIQDLSILEAISPHYAVNFMIDEGLAGFIILSDVILCATGGEALYADMGHLGGKSIRLAWVFVFIALSINYFGQGAFLMSGGENAQILFTLVKDISTILYVPFLILALCATIIASQAMISAVMALVYQGINLRIFPLMKIKYTSLKLRSQIYIGMVNWMLLIAVLIMILIFKTSASLSSAYGLAVTSTMTISAIFMLWIFKNTSQKLKLLVSSFVFAFDIIYLAAVFTKIPAGGYWSILIALFITAIIQVWIGGSNAMRKRFRSLDMDIFITSFEQIYSTENKLKGEAIFFTRELDKVSPYIVHCTLRTGIIYEKNILVSISNSDKPYGIEFSEMKEFTNGLYGADIKIGYMEIPDLPALFKNYGFNEKIIFYGVDDIKTNKLFHKIYAFIKRATPSFANYYNFPYNKLHGVVTRHEI